VRRFDTKKLVGRLLLVDDNKDIVTTVAAALERQNVVVDSFTDPQKALDHFRQHYNDYCMVVSDIRMPGVSGFEIAKQVNKLNPTIKIILLSAFDIHKNEFSKVLPSTRVDDFITKPFSIHEFSNKVMKYLTATKKMVTEM